MKHYQNKVISIEKFLKSWLELCASEAKENGNFESKTKFYNYIINEGLKVFQNNKKQLKGS